MIVSFAAYTRLILFDLLCFVHLILLEILDKGAETSSDRCWRPLYP